MDSFEIFAYQLSLGAALAKNARIHLIKKDQQLPTLCYFGFALHPNTEESDPKWKICRVKTVSTVTTVEWASDKLDSDGHEFKWSERESYFE